MAEQTRLATGDLRALPFADASFDVVVSSLAIHNIAESLGRRAAIAEAYRVLRPVGGHAARHRHQTRLAGARAQRHGMIDRIIASGSSTSST